MINYNNKQFKAILNSDNGEISAETIFQYKQTDHILTAEYAGGAIIKGQLIGIVDDLGNIEMHYHHLNAKNEFMTGICKSKPTYLANGKLRLHENWQWTSGDKSSGNSIIEEL